MKKIGLLLVGLVLVGTVSTQATEPLPPSKVLDAVKLQDGSYRGRFHLKDHAGFSYYTLKVVPRANGEGHSLSIILGYRYAGIVGIEKEVVFYAVKTPDWKILDPSVLKEVEFYNPDDGTTIAVGKLPDNFPK